MKWRLIGLFAFLVRPWVSDEAAHADECDQHTTTSPTGKVRRGVVGNLSVSEHFNTLVGSLGWPQSKDEVDRLSKDGLDSFMARCAIEPADFENCLACYAYKVAQDREAAAKRKREHEDQDHAAEVTGHAAVPSPTRWALGRAERRRILRRPPRPPRPRTRLQSSEQASGDGWAGEENRPPPQSIGQLVKTRRAFRRFHLDRDEDVSGTSGTGIVAEGVTFSTGKTVLNWTVSGKTSVAVYDSMAEMESIHGHDGRTRVVFIDD